jgi:hypothetical protein
MVRANAIFEHGTIRLSAIDGQVTIPRACWPPLFSGVTYVRVRTTLTICLGVLYVFEFPTDAKVGPFGRSLDRRFR